MNRACIIKNTDLHEQSQHASLIRPFKNNFVQMKTTYLLKIRILFVTTILTAVTMSAMAQTSMPPELSQGALKDQMKFLEERTRIYENFRAIREDMFQKIKGNILDSLSASNNKIDLLTNETKNLKITIDTLGATLESTKTDLAEITRTKNSISILGIELNKTAYNSLMWIIVAGLLIILAIGFLAFKRNMAVTNTTKKDLEELKNEFEAYRKTTREAREKMSMSHFLELKKLRGE